MAVVVLSLLLAASLQTPQAPSRTPLGAGLPPFSHGDHRREPCTTCHTSERRHGELRITSAADCRACHHAGTERATCTACHATVRAQPTLAVSFTPAHQSTSVSRPIRFSHAPHAAFACARCHGTDNDHTVTATCASCHTEHHTSPRSDCVACHEAAHALATHHVGDHATCTSAACHGAKAANLPDTRATCLVCHTRQATHQPGRNCNPCHQVERRT